LPCSAFFNANKVIESIFLGGGVDFDLIAVEGYIAQTVVGGKVQINGACQL
jgi:hypothetical protein